MLTYLKFLALLYTLIIPLTACAGVEWAQSDEHISIDEVQEAVQRGEVQELLGKPEKVVIWEGRRIETYKVLESEQIFYSAMPPILPIHFDAEYSYIIISYDNDGSLIEIQALPDDTADSAVILDQPLP